MLGVNFRDGEIILCQQDNMVYLIDQQRRRPIPSDVRIQWQIPSGRTLASCVLLNQLPLGEPLRGFQDGTIVQDCNGNLYQIENGQRRLLPAGTDIRQYPDVINDPVICRYVNNIPLGAPIQPLILPNGSVVRCLQGFGDIPSNAIFVIENSRRRWFPSVVEYDSYGSPLFQDVDCSALARIPPGPNIEVLLDGEVIRCSSTGAIYRIEYTESGVQRRHYSSFEIYQSHGSPRFVDLDCDLVNLIPEGPPMELLVPTPAAPLDPIVLTPTVIPLQQQQNGIAPMTPSAPPPPPPRPPPRTRPTRPVRPTRPPGGQPGLDEDTVEMPTTMPTAMTGMPLPVPSGPPPNQFLSNALANVDPGPEEAIFYEGVSFSGWGLRLPGPTVVPDFIRFDLPNIQSIKVGSQLRADIFALPDTLEYIETINGQNPSIAPARSVALISTEPPQGIRRLYETCMASPWIVLLIIIGIALVLGIIWFMYRKPS